MDNITPQYIAGFFDGEGSIGIYDRPNRAAGGVAVMTQLTQNRTKDSTALFEFLRAKYGGNISKQRTLSGRIKYNWALHAKGIKAFLPDILPYLVLKRDQAQILLTWLEKRPKFRRDWHGRVLPFTDAELEFTRKLVQLMKALKLDDLETVMAERADLMTVLHTLELTEEVTE